MKSLLIKIKNLLPYLLLVTIYFFFVNIEAQNSDNRIHKNFKSIKKIGNSDEIKSKANNYNKKIRIPVIPYDK